MEPLLLYTKGINWTLNILLNQPLFIYYYFFCHQRQINFSSRVCWYKVAAVSCCVLHASVYLNTIYERHFLITTFCILFLMKGIHYCHVMHLDNVTRSFLFCIPLFSTFTFTNITVKVFSWSLFSLTNYDKKINKTHHKSDYSYLSIVYKIEYTTYVLYIHVATTRYNAERHTSWETLTYD